jgi:hypothetical protein
MLGRVQQWLQDVLAEGARRRGAVESAEVGNPPYPGVGARAPKWAAERGALSAGHCGVVEEGLGHDLRGRSGGTRPVRVKASNSPDVGEDPGRDPAKGVLRWGVEGQPCRAENGPSPKTPSVNVPRGDARVGLDPRGGPTQPLDEHPLPRCWAGSEQAGDNRGLERDGGSVRVRKAYPTLFP